MTFNPDYSFDLPFLPPDLKTEHLFAYPVAYPTAMGKKLNITYQTASKYLSDLEEAGLLVKKRSGKYMFYYNLKLLNCLKT